MWSWVTIKVIETGIKLYSLVVFSIIPSLKQISSHVSLHITMLNVYFIKSHQQSSLPWILIILVQNNFTTSFNKPPGWGNILSLIQIDNQICEKMDTKVFDFIHKTVTLNSGQGHPKWHKNVELSGLYHYTKSEKNWSVNVWKEANV